MDLRQLRYLVAVVEERSISRAASRLNMSQPPLSTAIARMERELGVQLLDRHARGVEPTDAGMHLVEHARRLMATVDQVSASVVAVGTGRRGRLSVAAVSGSSWELLPESLGAFARDRPDVEIEIAEVPPAEVVERVRSQRADAGLVCAASSRTLERLEALDLDVAVVRREPLVLVLPAASAPAGTPVDLAALAGELWLVPGPADWPELRALVEDAWQRAGVHPARSWTVATLDAALHLVAAGFGVSLMPASAARARPGGVAVRPVTQPLAPLEWAVVWRRHERPSPVLARFLRASMSTPEEDRLGPAVARSGRAGP